MTDAPSREAEFGMLLLDLLRAGNDDLTVAECLHDHYGDAAVVIEFLIARFRALSTTLAAQMREWAALVDDAVRNIDEGRGEMICAGLREVARDIDPERSP